jgi:sulfoquinovosidase
MADFGEYLPTDVRLADGTDGMLAHNAWPTIWAEVNARAVASRGKTGDALFFMRAGFTGVSRHCPLLWAGDQSVDFSRHDGIGTVIRAALSSGLLGNAYHHSDVGGYTSVYGNVRTPELLMRWSELGAFSPVMRSHEGNRPDDNLQLDSDAEILAHFARMSRVHAALAPYVAALCREAAETGLPLQRPLFLDFEGDPGCWGIETQYAYGAELVVAPVIEAGAIEWEAYLPAGAEWVHLWTGARHAGGGSVTVAAPLGAPPVFYRADGAHAGLFAAIAADHPLPEA